MLCRSLRVSIQWEVRRNQKERLIPRVKERLRGEKIVDDYILSLVPDQFFLCILVTLFVQCEIGPVLVVIKTFFLGLFF